MKKCIDDFGDIVFPKKELIDKLKLVKDTIKHEQNILHKCIVEIDDAIISMDKEEYIVAAIHIKRLNKLYKGLVRGKTYLVRDRAND